MCQIWIGVVWNSMNILKIQIRSTIIESPEKKSPHDYLIAESHFREVAVIDSKDLTVVAITEVLVQQVNVNICRKLLRPTQLDNLHII